MPLVAGSPHNLKITTRADLAIAEAILRDRTEAGLPGNHMKEER